VGYARFHLWRSGPEKAHGYFERAVQEIMQIGYFRRAGQVRPLAAGPRWTIPHGFPAAECAGGGGASVLLS